MDGPAIICTFRLPCYDAVVARTFAPSGTFSGIYSGDLRDSSVRSIEFAFERRAASSWIIRELAYPRVHTLVWVRSGRARYVCGDARFSVHGGQMLLFPAGTRRSASTDKDQPWIFSVVGFTLEDANGCPATARGLSYVTTPHEPIDIGSAMYELEHHFHAQSPGGQLRSRGILMNLLGIYINAATRSAEPASRRPALDAVIDLLNQHPGQWYTADELAARAKLSPSRFRVLFQRSTGMSVVRYQNTARVRRAAGLLRSGEHTVSDVANLLAFNDVYYFSRLFKKMTGSTPSSHLAR